MPQDGFRETAGPAVVKKLNRVLISRSLGITIGHANITRFEFLDLVIRGMTFVLERPKRCRSPF